jgi:hypothetical protein
MLTHPSLHCRPKNHDGSIPNKAYYLFSNVKIENGGVSYYHPADQPPPPDAPTQCAPVLAAKTTKCHSHSAVWVPLPPVAAALQACLRLRFGLPTACRTPLVLNPLHMVELLLSSVGCQSCRSLHAATAAHASSSSISSAAMCAGTPSGRTH